MVEEVGYLHEEDHVPVGDAPVGDGRGQMRLSGAIGACEDQPPGRVAGEADGLLVRCPEQAPVLKIVAESIGPEGLEGKPRQ